jgi:hypothetical protein
LRKQVVGVQSVVQAAVVAKVAVQKVMQAAVVVQPVVAAVQKESFSALGSMVIVS